MLSPGEAAGPIVGGTLTQLVSLLGTPWAFDIPRGAVLLLEDVGERPYRVHRMLTQLAQSGDARRRAARWSSASFRAATSRAAGLPSRT